MKNYLYNKFIILLYNLEYKAKCLYYEIEYLYRYHFHGMITFFEYLVFIFFGEELLEDMWLRWNITASFYTELYYIVKKILIDKYEDLKLVLIWKLKRSDNLLAKKLCTYLNKYYWFRNNIIDFL